jgi:alkylhydroperoxidase family enzyme
MESAVPRRLEMPPEMRAAHARFLAALARPGTWFDGGQRLAVAAAARAADACAFCRTRKAALSPYAVDGVHDGGGDLSRGALEVIHRLRTDPGRLSRRFFDDALAAGLDETEYVEIVGVVAQITNVDTVCRALGLDPHPLPGPEPGEPSRRRPRGAKGGEAWVSMLAAADVSAEEADLYPPRGPAPNVLRALSLVPDEVRRMSDLAAAQYMPPASVIDLSRRRTLTRAQMELVAGRVSALNQCFY